MSRIIDNGDNVKPNKFVFSNTFLTAFKTFISAYDKKIEDLHNVSRMVDNNSHHGVCACSYRMRYITPSDVSTFISNLEKAMKNELLKPNASDCDLFAVESVKRFLQSHDCDPFDAPTITGNESSEIPKGATLADLTFAAESEIFNPIVYSSYELKERIKDMKSDADKIQNMHFSAAIKSIIDKLPSIMSNNAKFIMGDSLLLRAARIYIEDFIMFTVRLNYCTVCQMLKYAVPQVAYKSEPESDESNESANNSDNWDDDNEFFKESVDKTTTAPIYFIFSKGKTPIISEAIRKVTKSEYSHASIAFDASLNPMYSFGDSTKPDTYQTGKWGFKKEDIHGNAYNDIDVAVYGAYIDKKNIEKLKEIVKDFESHKTTFDRRILVNKLLHLDVKPGENKYKQVCSTFVDYLMNEIGVKLGSKNLMSPEDIRAVITKCEDSVFEVYSGKGNDYSAKKTEKSMSENATKPKTKRFDEVVTECCTGFLKTNDYIITNKIPFNCNMRDIVLQDMHPVFKDTISALKFIMNDERSPIHGLVVQYHTEPIESYDPDLIAKMFIGCCHHHYEIDNNSMNGYENSKNSKASMNTDVNWLDKITYGNMFYDGNYRVDAMGNNKVRPVTNQFETIYKMFGGCDIVHDNGELANNLIRISRVMKAIVAKYEEGCIYDWDLCRDILAVFGEIFTRNMLRLYYNNSSHVIASDQMEDTMIPGYMFCESFVMEADNEFKSNNNNTNAGTKLRINVRNAITAFINWIRDKFNKFLPSVFENSLKKQCDYINNGEALKKYNEISAAIKNGTYNLPTKKTYYSFDVHFTTEKIKLKEMVEKYKNDNTKGEAINEVEVYKQMLQLFNSNNSETLINEILGIQNSQAVQTVNLDDAFTKRFTNAILYSKVDATDCVHNEYTIKGPDFDNIWNSLVALSKMNGKTIADEFVRLGDEVKSALDDLKNYIPENDNSHQTENNDNTQKNAPFAAKAEQLSKIIQNMSSKEYTVAQNVMVKTLYVELYKTFKAIVDDFETVRNNGSNANTTNNTNNTNASGMKEVE